MQAKVSQPPERLTSNLRWPLQSPMITASFSILGIKKTELGSWIMELSKPTDPAVTLEVSPAGENTLSVALPSSVSGWSGFSIVFTIEKPVGWLFSDPAGVIHQPSSKIPAGMLIKPALPTVLAIGFMSAAQIGPLMEDPPKFNFSLSFQSTEGASPITIDDPTVILKPPTEGK